MPPTRCSATTARSITRGAAPRRQPGSSGSTRAPATGTTFDAALARAPACPAGSRRSPPSRRARSWPPATPDAKVLNALVDVVPGLVAGGADLTGNTGVGPRRDRVLRAARPTGRLVHYGIREHGMGAAMNGMAAHGGVLPVGGTFFVFSDYCRPADPPRRAVPSCKVI